VKNVLHRFGNVFLGVLKGFDRLVFRGKLRQLYSREGMHCYLSANHVLRKDFKEHAKAVTAEVLQASLVTQAKKENCYQYLGSSKTSEDEVARALADKHPVQEGLCAFCNVSNRTVLDSDSLKMHNHFRAGQECQTYDAWPESDVGGRQSPVGDPRRSEVDGQWHSQSGSGVGVVRDRNGRSEGAGSPVSASDAFESLIACSWIAAQGQESASTSSDSECEDKPPGTVGGVRRKPRGINDQGRMKFIARSAKLERRVVQRHREEKFSSSKNGINSTSLILVAYRWRS
jgi:hypothetical protein